MFDFDHDLGSQIYFNHVARKADHWSAKNFQIIHNDLQKTVTQGEYPGHHQGHHFEFPQPKHHWMFSLDLLCTESPN